MSWLAGWEYRLKLTIDHTKVGSDLTWFPLMVKLSTSSGLGTTDISAIFDELGTESLKIAITQSDGYTENYVEIEKWDSVGEEAILWTSKDGWVIDSDVDTILYLYYDSTHDDNSTYVGVVGSTPGKAVWDSSFLMVQHMADDPDTSNIKDSTANGYNGTKKGANEPIEITAKVGEGQSFDNIDDYIGCGTRVLSDNVTIEGIVKLTNLKVINGVFGVCHSTGYPGCYFAFNNTTVQYGNDNDAGNRRTWTSGSVIGTGSFTYFALAQVGASGTPTLYINNVLKTMTITTNIGTVTRPNAAWAIGRPGDRDVYYLDGIGDEIRISSTNRSGDWSSATYYTLWDEAITYSTEQTTAALYKIEIDWNNDGDFYDTNDDVSSNTKSAHYDRGKLVELGKAEVGQCSIVLNNANGLYTPSNSGGDLYGSLLPKRPIQIYAIYNGTKYDLFYGFIEEIIPHPHKTEQDCIITATDGLDFLSRHDMSTALYKDALTGTIHGYILTDAGWSATMRTLDAGQDTVPYWYGHDVKSRFAQEEIDDSEQGFSFVDGAGYFNFEDRHHRATATHQTSQATFNNTMNYITNPLSAKNVYNIVKVTVTPWELQSLATLWTLEETPSIPAGESRNWWADASVSGESVFVDAWTTLVATTDYTANSQSDGGGTDMTADINVALSKLAKTMKITLTNNGAIPAYITLLQARGTYYDDLTKVTLKAEDSTSQTAYQKRTYELNGKYMTSADKAQDYVTYAIGKYKNPRPELSMNGMNKNTTILAQILGLEISDRVTIVNDTMGINDDYFIDHMEHDISMSGKLHTVNYRLADTINEDFWCLDYSALASSSASGQTKLGY